MGNFFGDIQDLLEPASRVSYLRTRVTSKVDQLGLTPSGYPSGKNYWRYSLARPLPRNYSIVVPGLFEGDKEFAVV